MLIGKNQDPSNPNTQQEQNNPAITSSAKSALEKQEKILEAIKNAKPAVIKPLSTSSNMVFSKALIRGYVMKKIDNIKLGRMQDAFHKRKLTLNWKHN